MLILNQSASCVHVVNFKANSTFESRLKTARFDGLTDEDILSLCDEEESENTKRKKFCDIKVFLEFLHSENEARNIHEILSIELVTANVFTQGQSTVGEFRTAKQRKSVKTV